MNPAPNSTPEEASHAIDEIIATTRKQVDGTYHRTAPDSAIILSLATQLYLLKKWTSAHSPKSQSGYSNFSCGLPLSESSQSQPDLSTPSSASQNTSSGFREPPPEPAITAARELYQQPAAIEYATQVISKYFAPLRAELERLLEERDAANQRAGAYCIDLAQICADNDIKALPSQQPRFIGEHLEALRSDLQTALGRVAELEKGGKHAG